jgi:hypothetical protein
MQPETIIVWCLGYMIGLGAYSGYPGKLIGISPMWIFNTEYSPLHYYLNVPTNAIIFGFALLGIYWSLLSYRELERSKDHKQ